jgi:hypothetical protein
MVIAPESFAWTPDETHCFVKRQPVTAPELDRMVVAIRSAEADCIRYSGADPAQARRLIEAGLGECVDGWPPGARRRARRRVTFRAGDGDGPEALAARLRAFLAERASVPYKVAPPRLWQSAATVRFKMVWKPFPWTPAHEISFGEGPEPGRLGARVKTGYAPAFVGLAIMLHDWLGAQRAEDRRWFTMRENWTRDPGFHMPI